MKVGDLIGTYKLVYAGQAQVSKVDREGNVLEVITEDVSDGGNNVYEPTVIDMAKRKSGVIILKG